MYYAKINKETKEILDFEESTSQIVEIKTRAEKPAAKAGIDHIEKVKQLEEGSYTTEWAEVERPLTAEEEHQKKIEEMQEEIKAANERAEKAEKQAKIAKSQSLTALQAVGELAEERPSGTESEVI